MTIVYEGIRCSESFCFSLTQKNHELRLLSRYCAGIGQELPVSVGRFFSFHYRELIRVHKLDRQANRHFLRKGLAMLAVRIYAWHRSSRAAGLAKTPHYDSFLEMHSTIISNNTSVHGNEFSQKLIAFLCHFLGEEGNKICNYMCENVIAP